MDNITLYHLVVVRTLVYVNNAIDRSLKMNDQTPHHEPVTLRIVAGFGLALAALVVLAFAGGSLNVTASGVTMNVNPRQ